MYTLRDDITSIVIPLHQRPVHGIANIHVVISKTAFAILSTGGIRSKMLTVKFGRTFITFITFGARGIPGEGHALDYRAQDKNQKLANQN